MIERATSCALVGLIAFDTEKIGALTPCVDGDFGRPTDELVRAVSAGFSTALSARSSREERSRAARLTPIGYASSCALRLFAWHEVDNFGDRLGPALFHQISQRPVCIEARGLHPTFDGPRREIHCFLGTLAHVLEGPHRFVLWGFGTRPHSVRSTTVAGRSCRG